MKRALFYGNILLLTFILAAFLVSSAQASNKYKGIFFGAMVGNSSYVGGIEDTGANFSNGLSGNGTRYGAFLGGGTVVEIPDSGFDLYFAVEGNVGADNSDFSENINVTLTDSSSSDSDDTDSDETDGGDTEDGGEDGTDGEDTEDESGDGTDGEDGTDSEDSTDGTDGDGTGDMEAGDPSAPEDGLDDTEFTASANDEDGTNDDGTSGDDGTNGDDSTNGDDGNSSDNTNDKKNISAKLNTDTKSSGTYGITGKFGVILAKDWLLYGLAGWQHTRFDTDYTAELNDNTYAGSKRETLDGYSLGGGVEWHPEDFLFFRVEYNYTNYDPMEHDIQGYEQNLIEPSVSSLQGGIGFRF